MRKILGVSFGGGIVRASLIETGFRRSKPAGSEDVVLPENAGERPAFIVETLKRWKTEHAPYGAVLGLPLEHFSHQLIEMPAMKKADLRSALMFDLEKFLPLPVDEYIFDFVTAPAGPGNLKVLVLSVKKDVVNAYCRYFIEADVEILSVRCNTIDALCAVMDAAGEKGVSGLFVNMTDHTFEVTGLKNSMPVYLKCFSSNIDLAKELERLSELHPGPVYFLGDPGQLITEKFAGRKYHISIANALAGSRTVKPAVNLEFIPWEMIPPPKDYYPHLIGALSGAALVLFLLAGLTTYYKESRTLASIEAKRSAIKDKASKVSVERKKLELLQGDRKALFDFVHRSNVAVRALSDLSNVLSKDAWLINFSVDDKGKLEMEGFSGNTAKLVVELENSKEFKNVSFSAPIIAKEGEERFALKAEVEGLEK